MFKLIMKTLNLLAVLTYLAVANCSVVSVTTNNGIINGRTEDINVFGQDFRLTRYLGIPYAEPPVGNLRFKKPVPKTAFSTPLDAVRYGNACLQVDLGIQPEGDITYSEDCLFLNIYTPELQDDDERLAVMVWFHGGGFVIGSSDIYPGDHLAAYGHVIVVTVNYRLSVWGFLSTGDEHAVGNYGLWDQRLALTWIHENIYAFGGDSGRVTIFGESAGGASVVYQGLYPKNKGLFHRIIAQSGSVSWWASNDQGLQNTKKLSKIAGCETNSNGDMVACLRSLPAERLHEILDKNENGFKRIPIPFIPNYDSEFVQAPSSLTFVNGYYLPRLSREFFASLDVIGGMNNGEGCLAVSPFFDIDNPKQFVLNRTFFAGNLIPNIQKLAYPECTTGIIKDMIVAEYTNWKNPEDEHMIKDELQAVHSDFSFADPLYKMLDYHALSTANTYMYYFDDKTSNHLFCDLPWFDDIGHGDEIPYVFGYKNADHVTKWKFYANELEEQLSKRVIKLWSNFAKTG